MGTPEEDSFSQKDWSCAQKCAITSIVTGSVMFVNLVFVLILILVTILHCSRSFEHVATSCRPKVQNGMKELNHLFAAHPVETMHPSEDQLHEMGTTAEQLCKVLQHAAEQKKEDNSSKEEWGWWKDAEASLRESAPFAVICNATQDFRRFKELSKVYMGTKLVMGFSLGVYPKNVSEVPILANVQEFDTFFRLVESVACRHVYSPEHVGVAWDVLSMNITEQFDCLETVLGDLTPPVFGGGGYGLKVSKDRVLSWRQVNAINIARQVKALLDKHPDMKGNGTVCEIGGGAGYLAHYSLKMGVLLKRT